MSMFEGLQEASRGYASNPLRAGEFIVRLDECAHFNTEMKGKMWKNTLTVLGVISGDHRIGEEVHTFFKESVGRKTFLSNLKSFLAGVTGYNDEDVTPAHADAACSEQQPMRGSVFIVRGRERVSKDKVDQKTGEPVRYTVYDWMKAFTPDEIRQRVDAETVAKFFPNGIEPK